MITWALAAALAFPTPLPAAAASPVPEESSVPTLTQVMALPPQLRVRLQDEVVAGNRPELVRLERLVKFMFDKQGLGVEYQHDATYTVEEAFATRKANCLSFTLLFLAMAREAGLQAYAQEVEGTVAWHLTEKTVYSNRHVNAGVWVDGRRYAVDVAADSVIARQGPERVPDQRLLLHYYNNRTAELLTLGRVEAALVYVQAALELDPLDATSWNNAGVAYLRSGDSDAAERAYDKALDLDPTHGDALFNMVRLSQVQGDRKRERSFRRRLEEARSRNPFHQFLIAAEYEENGDHARAAEHYRSAIRLHDGEHRFHFGLARVYLHLGDHRRAGRALARAHALSTDATRSIYQAKLAALERLKQSNR